MLSRAAVAASGQPAVTHLVAQTAHGFVVGQAVRYNGSQYVLAKADAAANADVDGLVSGVVDANHFTIQIGGYIVGLAALAAGTDYFLDPVTAGGLTAAEPSAPGQVSKPLLHADAATTGYLLNMRGLVVPSKATVTLPFVLIADGTALAVGEDFASYTYEIGADLDGYSLSGVVAVVKTVSSAGLPGFGVRKNAATEMLSTGVTIDANETSSRTAATPPVIKNDGSQTVAAGDVIHFDCDAAGTGAKGCEIRLTFTSP